MKPLVSICMPTFNSEAFLEERLASIGSQAFSDWELIVMDSASDDATLQMIEAFAKRYPKVYIHQAPRDGIYTNINRAIKAASGKYVYIATSDDTMSEDCLYSMVMALESHPGCGLAHCKLRRINPDGSDESPNWWDTHSTFARSSGPLLNQDHMRLAPHDGLLHMLGHIVYVSLTQLLIRKSLFDQIGYFKSDWGSVGDFNWDMRASLTTNTVHVASTWASWRLHPGQATAQAGIGNDSHHERIDAMVWHAIENRKDSLGPAMYSSLIAREIGRWEQARRFMKQHRDEKSAMRRRVDLARHLMSGNWAARQQLKNTLRRGPGLAVEMPHVLRSWVEKGIGSEVFELVDPAA